MGNIIDKYKKICTKCDDDKEIICPNCYGNGIIGTLICKNVECLNGFIIIKRQCSHVIKNNHL